jgi:hypothetical protein
MHFTPVSAGSRSALNRIRIVREITSELDYSWRSILTTATEKSEGTGKFPFSSFFFPPYMRVVSLIVFPDRPAQIRGAFFDIFENCVSSTQMAAIAIALAIAGSQREQLGVFFQVSSVLRDKIWAKLK